jgi:hypothetical protein
MPDRKLTASLKTTWGKPADIALDKPAMYLSTGLVVDPELEEIQAIGWDKNIISEY